MNRASLLAITIGILGIVSQTHYCLGSSDVNGLPPGWQQLGFLQLADTVTQYDLQEGPTNRKVRGDVSLAVWNQYFADDKKFHATMLKDRDSAIVLAGVIDVDLNAPFAAKLGRKLLAFCNNKDCLGTMDFSDLVHLCQTLDYVRIQTFPLATNWTTSSDQWRGLGLLDTIELADLIHHDTSKSGIESRQMVFERAWPAFLNEPSAIAKESPSTIATAVRVFCDYLDPTQRKYLAGGVLQRFRNSKQELAAMPVGDVASLVRAVRMLSGTDDDVAHLLADWAAARDARPVLALDDYDIHDHFTRFEFVLQKVNNFDAFCKAVAQDLQDNADPLGPTSGKLRAYVVAAGGNLQKWKDELRSRLNNSLVGDDRAAVLLALANTEEAAEESANDMNGADWAKQAFQIAVSEKCRFAATEWLARHLSLAGQATSAQVYIYQSMQEMKDPRTLHQLQILDEQVDAVAQAQRTVRQHAADREQQLIQGRLALFQMQLERAKRLNRPTNEILAWETTIHNTQAQLSSATTLPSP